MKRFVAMFLSMTLILSCIPIQVFALENTWDDDGAYSDMEREPFGGGSGDLQDTEERVYEFPDYDFILTVAPADTEIDLRSGTALRYTMDVEWQDPQWDVEEVGVYGRTLVVAVSKPDTTAVAPDAGWTLFISLDSGELLFRLAGTDVNITPVRSGKFLEQSDPDALYQIRVGSLNEGNYVLCEDPGVISPLILLEEDGLYNVFNTVTGEYFEYHLKDFSPFGTCTADGVLIGRDSYGKMYCISSTGEPLFDADIQPVRMDDDTLSLIVQDDSGNYGVYGLDGREKIPCAYDHIIDYSGQAAVVSDGSYQYVADETGPLCDTETYSTISSFSNGAAVGHRGVWGYSGYDQTYDYHYETDDLIFDDGSVLDLADTFGGQYATVYYSNKSWNPFDPSAICVEVESYTKGTDSTGHLEYQNYELNFRGMIDQAGKTVVELGGEYSFSDYSHFDEENPFYNGKNSFMEINTVGAAADGRTYLLTKKGDVIVVPSGADVIYIKDNYLLIYDGTRSYILDETGTEIWDAQGKISGGGNLDVFSPHILLDSGLLFLETREFRPFPLSYGLDPADGEVYGDLLVLRETEHNSYSVFNDTREILSGLTSQPYITPESCVLAVGEGGYLSGSNYAYKLQYYDAEGKALWPEDTYYSQYSHLESTDYLYGIEVLTENGYGYMGVDGEILVAPRYWSLDTLQPGRLLYGTTAYENGSGVLLDGETGAVIAQVDPGEGRDGIGADLKGVHNGAASITNIDAYSAFTTYVIYPWGSGETGGETGEEPGEGTGEEPGGETGEEPGYEEHASFGYAALTPASGSGHVLPNISLTTKFQIRYDREIEPNRGYLTIYEADTGELVETISADGARLSRLTEIEFNTRSSLKPDTEYYVVADEGLVRDADDPTQVSVAIEESDNWRFTTVGLEVYGQLMTEEDLFLRYPRFLQKDNLPASARRAYMDIINSIDQADRNAAAIFWAMDNLSTDFLGTLLSAFSLEQEAEERVLYSLLTSASSHQKLTDSYLLSKGQEAVGMLSRIIKTGNPTNTIDLIRALYETFPGEMKELYPDFTEGQIVKLLNDSDAEKMLETQWSGQLSNTLTVADKAMVLTSTILEYFSVRQASVEIIDTFISELERMGYTDEMYEQLKRTRDEIYESSLSDYVLEEFINSELVKALLSNVSKVMFEEILSPNKLVESLVSLGGKSISMIYEQFAPSAEQILDVYTYSMYAGRLYWMVENLKDRFEAGRGSKADIRPFQIIYSLYIAALQGTGESMKNLSLNDVQKQRLQAYSADLESYSYAAYLAACLDYAQDYIADISAQLEYELSEDGKLYIVGFPQRAAAQSRMMRTMSAAESSLVLASDAGEQTWLVIPEEIDGYPVAGIEDNAFAGNDTLQTVYIAADLEYVGEAAFSGCKSLKFVDFLQGAGDIRARAFSGSGSLTAVSLAGSASVGASSFADCSNLQYIVTDSMETTFADDAVEDSDDVWIIGLPGSAAAAYAQESGLNFTSEEPTVQAVRVERLPDKTSYTVGEDLDTNGMVLDLTMSDGTHQRAEGGWLALDEGKTDTAGIKTIQILYGAHIAELTVTVTGGWNGGEQVGQDIGDSDSGDDEEDDGGSGGAAFAVTAGTVINGSLSITPKQAARGSVVTITAEPDTGYVLDSLQVFDRSGNEIALRKSGDRYTFIMPASQVSVKAVFAKQSAQSGNPFLDVLESDYFYDAVLWAVSNGITAGTSDTAFNPNAVCTRAQTVTMLWRAAGSPQPRSSANPFHDVKESDYYYTAVLWAAENGITAGTGDASFSPDAICNRSQVMTFLYRDHGTEAVEKTSFTDVEEGAYYYDAVQWAAQEGITAGTGPDTFGPDDSCTRAQIVTFLYKALAN